MNRPVFNRRKCLILCLLAWWVIVAVFYMNTAIKVKRVKAAIRKMGVKTAKDFSRRVSLPLLELDLSTLSTLLNEATGGSDIIYAAIIDHKNNIIAYASVDLIKSAMRGETRTVDHVVLWEGNSSGYNKIINFSSNVTYAKTKIGEIYLAVSADKIKRLEKRFVSLAFSSFAVLLFVVLFLYKGEIGSVVGKLRSVHGPETGKGEGSAETTRIACPLCGTRRPFSRDVFNCTDLDRFRIIHTAGNAMETGSPDNISLSELGKRKDFGWLKRQVIARCIEIIKKLTD